MLKIKIVYRDDPVEVLFLKELASIARDNIVLVCTYKDHFESETAIAIITNNKIIAKKIQQILSENRIGFERVKNSKYSFFRPEYKILFTLSISELNKIKEVFKKENFETENISRKEIKI